MIARRREEELRKEREEELRAAYLERGGRGVGREDVLAVGL